MMTVVKFQNRIVTLFAALCIVHYAAGQNLQLMYLHTDQGLESRCFPNNGQAVLRSFPGILGSAGLLPSDSYELFPNLTDSRFHVIYDSALTPVGDIELRMGENNEMRPLKKTDEHYYMYHSGYNFNGRTNLTSNPPVLDSTVDSAGYTFLLEFDAEEN